MLWVIFCLDTKRVDYTSVFLHAPFIEDVYICMPRGSEEEGQVLKMAWSLYWYNQSPRDSSNMLKVGFAQSSEDPCHFIQTRWFLVYFDDTLFYSPTTTEIDKMLNKLKELEISRCSSLIPTLWTIGCSFHYSFFLGELVSDLEQVEILWLISLRLHHERS